MCRHDHFSGGDGDPGPFGPGVAEPAMTPTAPAIANAIYDAVGVRIRTCHYAQNLGGVGEEKK